MSNRYKLILSNKSIYREVDLSDAQKTVRIGTTTGCDIRLSSNLFFKNFELTLTLQNDVWTLTCSDDIYISVDNVRKLMFTQLAHGDHLQIKYRASDNDVFVADFAADFDYAEKDYNRIINISGTRQFSIGTSGNCDISLRSEFLKNDLLRVENQGDMLLLKLQNSTYGIYKNGQRVTSGSAKINNRDFFSLGEYSFYYKDRQLYTTESDGMTVSQLPTHIHRESKSAMIYPKFNRSTRIKIQVPKDDIPVLDPPSVPQKPKQNLLLTILPSLAMVVMIVVLRGIMSSSGGSNMSYILMSVGMMGMGIITSIITYFSTKKEYKASVENRDVKYHDYIVKKEQDIQLFRKAETEMLDEIYYAPEKDQQIVEDFSGELFDRLITDEDFLAVRIGTGSAKASRKIGFKKQEKFATDDPLAPLPEKLANDYATLKDAPVITHLNGSGVVGVAGAKSLCYSFAKNMIVDLTVRQYYKDVNMFLIVDEESKEQFKWTRMIPHFVNNEMHTRNIAYDTDSLGIMLEYLYRVLSARSGQKGPFQSIVVLAFSSSGIKTHPVSQFLEKGRDLNATFVFFSRYEELLPEYCSQIITLDNTNQGVWIDATDKNTALRFSYQPISDAAAERIATRLAPIYCEEVSLESALTKSITLYDLLGIYSAEDLDLGKRWAGSNIERSMAAPLGVKTKNEVVYLDLHERAHGPHGLVAGTTGSGKSEILQSYVLSMATLFHPYEVSFVIIDFKGGGMANQFRDLPHLVGAITNIDGHEINRSLMSIKAELEKRQRLFAEHDVNNIASYIKLYKSRSAAVPLPHLVIIVDEFAELKAEQPDFMKELISAARIGRSLGVHLILATQKPAGQVNEQIWSNSRFKLCLKVQTKEDSNEVIKSPLAAEIKEPGRAYLQVGNNEIFDLFQSGYSGAPAHNDDSGKARSFAIHEVELSGRRKRVFAQKKQLSNESSETQLDALVDYVNRYCADNQIAHLPNICLPPLESLLPYEKPSRGSETDIQMVIGIYDDPRSQLQGKAMLNLSNGNVVIIGSSQFGKTNLLQLMIRSIADLYTPEEANLYVLDFGSMALRSFESLSHVGGVVTAGEDEKLKNLLRMVTKELQERKEKFAKIGITSFHSYKDAGFSDIPQIVIIIDNFIGMKELYPEYDDDLLHICREGVAYGISVVITSLQTNGISYKYMSNFPNRVALYCNSGDEYSALFDRCRMQPAATPGRGLVSIRKSVYEVQTYLTFVGEREIDRVASIHDFIAERNTVFDSRRARPIPEVPKRLDLTYARKNLKYMVPDYSVPIAIDYETVEFVLLDMLRVPTLAISGREKSGKTNLLSLIMDDCQNHVFDFPVEAYIVDGYERQLERFSNYGFVEQYTIDVNDIEAIFMDFESKLSERKKLVQESGIEALKNEPLLLCVIESQSAFEAGAVSKQAVEVFKRILTNYKRFKVMFVFSNVPNVAAAYGSPELLKQAKEAELFYFMDHLANSKILDFNAATLRQFKKPIETGDAFCITSDGAVTRQRVILNMER